MSLHQMPRRYDPHFADIDERVERKWVNAREERNFERFLFLMLGVIGLIVVLWVR